MSRARKTGVAGGEGALCPARATQFKKGRKPHNARSTPLYESLDELIQLVGNEPRTVVVKGKPVTMTQAERTFRLLVERALKGSVHDVVSVLRLMMRYPCVSGSYKTELVVVISGVDVFA